MRHFNKHSFLLKDKFLRSRGQTLAIVLILILFSVAALVLFKDFKKTYEPQGNYGKILKEGSNVTSLDREIRKCKNQAQLVIIGKLINRSRELNLRGSDEVVGYGYYDLEVEAVERGTYLGNQINICVGWFSNYVAGELFPPFTKKDYRNGDRIRVFLNFDREKNIFYTPLAFNTIEYIPE